MREEQLREQIRQATRERDKLTAERAACLREEPVGHDAVMERADRLADINQRIDRADKTINSAHEDIAALRNLRERYSDERERPTDRDTSDRER